MRLFYSVKEVCQALSVGRTTVYQAFKDDRMRPVKLGKRTLVPREELERFAATLTQN